MPTGRARFWAGWCARGLPMRKLHGRKGSGKEFFLGAQLAHDAEVRPYSSTANMPDGWRALWVYTVDPSLQKRDGETQKIRIPYEPLEPGPVGGLFAVDTSAPPAGTRYRAIDLDDPKLLRSRGVHPDEADARFHGQMVYAIASLTYEAFRKALGRLPGWAFDNQTPGQPNRLVLAPFAMEQANAYYSRKAGKVCFGYTVTGNDHEVFPPNKVIFTTLSSDVITHEVSHAILDGLRPYFSEPTNPDVPAFHEAFADLMAIFQRFNFADFVKAQLRAANGDISAGTFLDAIAPEIGYVTNSFHGLRNYMAKKGDIIDDAASGESKVTTLRMAGEQEHRRGAVLADAVFEAFVNVVKARTRPIIRLATGGRATLRDGEMNEELLDHLTARTRRIAGQFRTICIRAIDYCPPVDLTFGDYLRAIITADTTLVGADPHGYREALINAFRRRGIYPEFVRTMSERALVWGGPMRKYPPVPEFNLGKLRFDGDPGAVPKYEDARAHAIALGKAITADPILMAEMGLRPPSSENGSEVEPFEVSSLRTARRAGPDGQISFDLIAEVVQCCRVPLGDGRTAPYRGGSTIIFDAYGRIRFLVRKNLNDQEGSPRRRNRFEAYVTGPGKKFWETGDDANLMLNDDIFSNLCLHETTQGGKAGTEKTKDKADGKSKGDGFKDRDIVGKTWVKVLSPPGVPDGTDVDVDGTFDIPSGTPARVTPDALHEYFLEHGGKEYSAEVTTPRGHSKANPHIISLEED